MAHRFSEEIRVRDLSVVMYHYVRPIQESAYPGIKGLELSMFEEQLAFFQKQFRVITMEQVMDAIEGKCSLPERAMLLTFDDGYMDHYQYVFPLLQQYHMQGSFFVPSSLPQNHTVLDVNKIHFILACADIDTVLDKLYAILDTYRERGWEMEPNAVLFAKLAKPNRWDPKEVIFVKRLLQSYLEEDVRGEIVNTLFSEIVQVPEADFSRQLYVSKEQIIEMRKAGMYFGLHGERHYWLNQLPEDKMKQDIQNSLQYFRDVMDPAYLAMNYPYGGYNAQVLAYVKEIGCKVGFSVEARHVDLQKDDPLLLPRLDTNDFPPKSERWRLD